MNKNKIIRLFEEFIAGAEPKVKPETKPIPKPGTRPDTKPSRPSTPFKPDIRPGIKPLAKTPFGAEPKVKPETKPIPKPDTRPGTKPSRPSTPFKPDIRPGIKPLAKIKERVNNLIIRANKNPENKLYASIVGFIAKSMGISPKQAAPIETGTPDAITDYLKKGLDSGDNQFKKIVSFYKK